MSLNYVTLTLDVYDGQGNPVTKGTATFTPSAQLTDTTDHELITQLPIVASFHVSGSLPVVKLLATDNGAPLPLGWAWSVSFDGMTNAPAAFSFFLPFTSGSSQYLSAQVPVSAPSSLLGSTAAGVSVFPSGDTTGATDQANITAAEALGRTVYLAPGTFWVTGLVKQAGTYWQGAGTGATILKLAAGADADVIQGAGFGALTLTGANTWASSGIWDFGVSGMTIDGNAANQSGTSYGLRVYGYQWTLRDLAVRNCLTDGIWTEWGPLGTNAPVTTDGSEVTAVNVKCFYNGRHGWSHLGPSDGRMTDVLCFLNNQSAAAAGVGLWALADQISNVCSTASGMNGTSASGFTGTFTVAAAAAGGATDLYASSGTLKVATSGTAATMTYTGKTAATFTGCTVTSGSGTFVTGHAVTTSAQKFTTNGLQAAGCHSWGNSHTWAAVFDGQVSDAGGHFEGAEYGQLLIRSSANKAGGFVYDLTGIVSGLGIQLGDNGSTPGVPLSAALTANACDIRCKAYDFLNDTAARSSLNWVSATQSSADLIAVTKGSGTYSCTVAAGSNGVDLSTFTGGSPGTLFVGNTQSIPAGAGTITVATAKGTVTCTYTSTNGVSAPTRSAGTQFNGVVATGTSGSGYTMSTGGAVALANMGSLAIGGSADSSSRIRVQAQSGSTALSTGASKVQEFGIHTIDAGTASTAFRVRGSGTDYLNLNTSALQLQLPNAVDLQMFSDNYSTKTVDISGSTGAGSLTSLALGSPLPLMSGGTGQAAASAGALLTALGAAALQAAPVNFKVAAPTATASTTLIMMGIGATCQYTPAGSGLVQVTVTGYRATASTATNLSMGARWGPVAGPPTTVAAGSNGGEISTIASWSSPSAGVLDVASTAGYAASGTIWAAASGSTVAQVTYTGIAAGQFTGCAYVSGSATGTVATGGAVTGVPQNSAPLTGTRFGTSTDPVMKGNALSPNSVDPFTFTDVLTLTPASVYWLDLAASTSNGSDSATLTNISVTLAELP